MALFNKMNSIKISAHISSQSGRSRGGEPLSGPLQPFLARPAKADTTASRGFFGLRTPVKSHQLKEESGLSSENNANNVKTRQAPSSFKLFQGKSSKNYILRDKHSKSKRGANRPAAKREGPLTNVKRRVHSKATPSQLRKRRNNKGGRVGKSQTEKKRRPGAIMRSLSISCHAKHTRSECPLRRTKDISFARLIRSDVCLRRLVRMQTTRVGQMEGFFGVRKIKQALGRDPQGLADRSFDLAVLNDIFPTMYQSQGTYSEFSSSSLEEGESKAKMKYFQHIENLEKMKAIRDEQKDRDRTSEDRELCNLIFGASAAHSTIGEVVSSRTRSHLSVSEQSRVTPKETRQAERLAMEEMNPQFFESFSKGFFAKKHSQKERSTIKKSRFVCKKMRRKVNRKPNKSVHLFKHARRTQNTRLGFHSREKRRKLFGPKRSSPLQPGSDVKRLICFNNQGQPRLYTSQKHPRMDMIWKDTEQCRTSKKFARAKTTEEMNISSRAKAGKEFKRKANFFRARVDRSVTQRSEETLIEALSTSKKESKCGQVTSGCKLKSGSGVNGGLSLLSSTQDFLKCESSYPSLVLNIVQSSQSIKKESQAKPKSRAMSPIEDTEEAPPRSGTGRDSSAQAGSGNLRMGFEPLEESNIFESIFSFKNEHEDIDQHSEEKPNLFNLEIESNLNVFIGSRAKKANCFKSSFNRNATRRKGARTEIDKLGRLIEKQKRFIASKNPLKLNKSAKENVREVKQRNALETPKPRIFIFNELVNRKRPSRLFQNPSLLLAKKSYSSLARAEGSKVPAENLNYSKKKCRKPNTQKQRAKMPCGKWRAEGGLGSSEYNKVNRQIMHSRASGRVEEKRVSPLLKSSQYKTFEGEPKLLEKNSPREYHSGKGVEQRGGGQRWEHMEAAMGQNKSEMVAKMRRKMPTHLIKKYSIKPFKYAKSGDTESMDKRQLKSVRKHKIMLVPESMVTGVEKVPGICNNRHKILRKKNYSLFQRENKASKFGAC